MTVVHKFLHDDNEVLNKIAETFNNLIHKKKLDIKTIHLATGISVASLNNLRNGIGNPTLSNLLALAKFFNLSIDQLISQENSQDTFLTVHVYHIDDVHDLKHKVTEEIINIKNDIKADDKDLFAVRLTNSCMMPFYDKNSIFIISPSLNLTDGDLVLVSIYKKSIDKHISFFRRVFLQKDNILFKTLDINSVPEAYDKYKIIGVVVKIIQNF